MSNKYNINETLEPSVVTEIVKATYNSIAKLLSDNLTIVQMISQGRQLDIEVEDPDNNRRFVVRSFIDSNPRLIISVTSFKAEYNLEEPGMNPRWETIIFKHHMSENFRSQDGWYLQGTKWIGADHYRNYSLRIISIKFSR